MFSNVFLLQGKMLQATQKSCFQLRSIWSVFFLSKVKWYKLPKNQVLNLDIFRVFYSIESYPKNQVFNLDIFRVFLYRKVNCYNTTQGPCFQLKSISDVFLFKKSTYDVASSFNHIFRTKVLTLQKNST